MTYKRVVSILILLFLLNSCTTDDSGRSTTDSKRANLKALGTSAQELLSDEKFSSIRIEMAYVTGYQPSQETIDNLKNLLTQRTYKPDGITITTRAVTTSNKAPFSINEIAEIESEVRTAYNAGDEIAVFIYFADGSNENDSNSRIVLGSAFRNTSIVIYGETIKTISNRTNSPNKATVESTVVNHEFGHLFGLVNLGTPLQSDHEDDANSGHCEVAGCLMNANVEFGRNLIDMVGNNSVLLFDEQCLRDLQANGGR